MVADLAAAWRKFGVLYAPVQKYVTKANRSQVGHSSILLKI